MKIITRAEWDARPPKNPPTAITTPTPELWLHHSASPSGYAARVRAIQNFHMDQRGWNDIAYSFLVNHAGDIYEGRGFGIRGAHTKNHNSVSHGICLMGHYNQETPTPQALQSLSELLVYGHERDWWPDTFTGGHRDTRGGNPGDCPGDNLYPLIPEINNGGVSVFTDHEITELKRLVAALDEVGSNGTFAKFSVEQIRRERQAGGYAPKIHGTHDGITEEDADAKYVPKGRPVYIRGG